MPADRDGVSLRIGDRVTLEFEVVGMQAAEEECDLEVELQLSERAKTMGRSYQPILWVTAANSNRLPRP
jgi:hypothetical protein